MLFLPPVIIAGLSQPVLLRGGFLSPPQISPDVPLVAPLPPLFEPPAPVPALTAPPLPPFPAPSLLPPVPPEPAVALPPAAEVPLPAVPRPALLPPAAGVPSPAVPLPAVPDEEAPPAACLPAEPAAAGEPPQQSPPPSELAQPAMATSAAMQKKLVVVAVLDRALFLAVRFTRCSGRSAGCCMIKGLHGQSLLASSRETDDATSALGRSRRFSQALRTHLSFNRWLAEPQPTPGKRKD